MEDIESMEKWLELYGDDVVNESKEIRDYYYNKINEPYLCHGIKVFTCLSRYDNKDLYYTLVNTTNNVHVHCSNRKNIEPICSCFEKLKNSQPIKNYKYNIRNKAMKLLGYKVVYR